MNTQLRHTGDHRRQRCPGWEKLSLVFRVVCPVLVPCVVIEYEPGDGMSGGRACRTARHTSFSGVRQMRIQDELLQCVAPARPYVRASAHRATHPRPRPLTVHVVGRPEKLGVPPLGERQREVVLQQVPLVLQGTARTAAGRPPRPGARAYAVNRC